MNTTRAIGQIVIHCSDSANGVTVQASEIDTWHRARGFHRSEFWRQQWNPTLTSIGYHFIVQPNGTVSTARHRDEIGAHVLGWNKNSIGICMVGRDQWTAGAWDALAALVRQNMKLYPDAVVLGHRDLSPDTDGDGVVEKTEWLKTCPNFDVSSWMARGMQPAASDLLGG